MKKAIRFLIAIIGAALGVTILALLQSNAIAKISSIWLNVLFYFGVAVLGFLIFFIFSKPIVEKTSDSFKKVEKEMVKVPVGNLAVGTFGLIIGLLIAFLISQTVSKLEIPFLGNIVGIILSILIYGIFGYLGIKLSIANIDEIKKFLRISDKAKVGKKRQKNEKIVGETLDLTELSGFPKVLDTSVIIDGRILDIIKTHFLDGPLVVPTFVLEELQTIADSADSIKRQRGRRGLDIINEMKNGKDIDLIIKDIDFPDIAEVDMKLLSLCKEIDGKIITNDYNLNKVAVLQEIEVLNVNELANSIKVVVYPGERLEITVLKEGKGNNQGLGYLNDGTMVVVEGGKNLIGKTINTDVTSVIQTAAGKMIFVKPI